MRTVSITVEKKYLALPISDTACAKTVLISENGQLVDDITLRLDFISPKYRSYYPIGRFIGKTLTFEADPDVDLSALKNLQTDDPQPIRQMPHRPTMHFTAPYGWINDPNGLFVYTSPVTGKTLYHMFYQHNPYDYVWGNMHWGHAISEDLFTWQDMGIALFPDKDGTMFSGSAIVDYDNKSGLQNGKESPILLFYTCAGGTSRLSAGKRFTQCMAYSPDGGMSFVKYENNPIIGHINAGNRDPKVIWCEEAQKFVMALYIDRNEYCLLTSDNLLQWNILQYIDLPGDGECPDFYPLCAGNERKWILSGASGMYLTMDYSDGLFVQCGGVKRLSYGTSAYAAQTFSYKDEAQRIQIAWNRNTDFGGDPICGSMGMPVGLTLAAENGEYYLQATPVCVPSALGHNIAAACDIYIDANDPLKIPLDGGISYMFSLSADAASESVEADILGMRITADIKAGKITAGNREMPLIPRDGQVDITVITDSGTMEIYSGKDAILTVACMPDGNIREMCVRAKDKSLIKKAEVYKLCKTNRDISVLVFGEVLWDVYPNNRSIGGAPFNFAAHCSLLGADTTLISAVGNDALGEETVFNIMDHGIDARLVKTSEKPTGTCSVTLAADGSPSYRLATDTAYDNIVLSQSDEKELRSKQYDLMYFNTLCRRSPTSRTALEKAIGSARPKYVMTDLNLRPDCYTDDSIRFCLSQSDFVKLSDEEAPLLDLAGITDSNSLPLDKALAERYPNIKLLILTKGKSGSTVFDLTTGKRYDVGECEAADVVSTVGAGDCYAATFICNYLKGKSIEECMESAAKRSAIVVSSPDALPNCLKN